MHSASAFPSIWGFAKVVGVYADFLACSHPVSAKKSLSLQHQSEDILQWRPRNSYTGRCWDWNWAGDGGGNLQLRISSHRILPFLQAPDLRLWIFDGEQISQAKAKLHNTAVEGKIGGPECMTSSCITFRIKKSTKKTPLLLDIDKPPSSWTNSHTFKIVDPKEILGSSSSFHSSHEAVDEIIMLSRCDAMACSVES